VLLAPAGPAWKLWELLRDVTDRSAGNRLGRLRAFPFQLAGEPAPGLGTEPEHGAAPVFGVADQYVLADGDLDAVAGRRAGARDPYQ
jgi:hypothetical protein